MVIKRSIWPSIFEADSNRTRSWVLTQHYDNGGKSYEMQQAIQPGDQMWVNVASLIRNRVPDRKG
jgi:hypothetical protein